MSQYVDIMASQTFPARSPELLGMSIRALRVERGMTQAELARAASVSRQWLITLETAARPGIELGRVMQVLDALDASLTIRDDRGPG